MAQSGIDTVGLVGDDVALTRVRISRCALASSFALIFTTSIASCKIKAERATTDTAGTPNGASPNGAPTPTAASSLDSADDALLARSSDSVAMYSALFYWMEGTDTARSLTEVQAETASVAAVLRLFVDSAGTLRRYDYSPVSHSGDWSDDLIFIVGPEGRLQGALRRAATTATPCGAIVRVEERLVPVDGQLKQASRAVLDAASRPLSDSTCAESLPPIGVLPASFDSLATHKLLPANWRALRHQTTPPARVR